MNFIKVEDMAKLGKKCNEKITVEDLKKLNNSQNNTKIEAMKKYKEMVLIITELKTGQLLAVLDGITKTKLDYWIWHVVPLKCHKKIIGYSTDMNKGYANSLGEICGNPIQSVDKMHLFIEANRVVDQVRDISRYTLQMNFIKVEDMAKLGKKCNEKITVEDLKKLNNSQNNTKIEAMKKYKEKADQRLNIAQINKNDFYNSKGEKIDY
ncbi:MAG: transposase [Candidatus Gracilibacteria bacterium]|nr:transposase [Candidatus Gracilibacteria bacterium]